MTDLSELNKYYDIRDADAIAADLRAGKVAYGPDGKVTGTGVYSPAMMDFDGSTGFYSASGIACSGNKVVMVAMFARTSFTGGSAEYIGRYKSANWDRIAMVSMSNDHATPTKQDVIQCIVRNSVGTEICRLLSPVGYLDGNRHGIMFAFDGDNGLATFIIDGVDADDTGNGSRTAPTTGTLETANCTLEVGASGAGPTNPLDGQIGSFGINDSYETDWTQFMDANGNPVEFDGSGWLFYNPHAFMEDNRGTAGNMTKNGTIIVG